MILATAADVIRRARVEQLAEYEDVAPMTDCAGFYAFRRYPQDTILSRIVTRDGRPAVRCYVRFVVQAPATPESVVCRVELQPWFFRRWRHGRSLVRGDDDGQDEPGSHDRPNAESAGLLRKARIPVDLDADDVGGDFLYDVREDVFRDATGSEVTPAAMLEYAYAKHLRTLRLAFRIRWSIGSAIRTTVRTIVWKGQDAALWLLFNLYDIELTEDTRQRHIDRRSRGFFHKYKPRDFRRITDEARDRPQFFGFVSSSKSFLTNLCMVMLACVVLYWTGPRGGFLKVVYSNTALTTTALVFAFLVADTLGPWLLIQAICGLSRMRDAVVFFSRKVDP